MKLKKLIASVLSATMLSAMIVMPVRAETSTWWELDNTALTSYSNASNGSLVAMTKAGGGKAAGLVLIARAKALAEEFGLLWSGGSDYHGAVKPDVRMGVGSREGTTPNIPDEYGEKLRAEAALG